MTDPNSKVYKIPVQNFWRQTQEQRDAYADLCEQAALATDKSKHAEILRWMAANYRRPLAE